MGRDAPKLPDLLRTTPYWGTKNGVHSFIFGPYRQPDGSRTTCSEAINNNMHRFGSTREASIEGERPSVLPAEAAPGARARNERGSDRSLRSRPGGGRRLFAFSLLRREFLEHAGQDGRHGRELFRIRIAGNDFEVGLDNVVGCWSRHSGMFPCFFGGCTARLVRSARIPLITTMRVAAGSMTPSSSPRSAARNGDATL